MPKAKATKATKGVVKKPVAKNTGHGASMMSFSAPRPETFLQKQAGEFSALNRALKDRLGCAVPPFDPYMLLALTDSSGYLSAGHHWKGATVVGQGYDCSDRLKPHLKRANEDQSFHDLLESIAWDLDMIGTAFVEIVKTTNSVNFYHVPAVKTRVRPRGEDGDLEYIQYEYGPGILAYTEHEAYRPGKVAGVRHLKLLSRRGNKYYGDPVYISAKRPLSLNVSVLQVAEKFFENSLIGDKAITLKGTELDPEERDKIRNYLANSVRGVDNAHKILFFEVGPNEEVVIDDLNTGIKDADFSKFRQDNRDEAIAANLAPMKLIGVSTQGQIGAPGELEGQLRNSKISFVDGRQRKIEEFFQILFEDAGLPDPESFKLNPLDISAGTADMSDLATGVESGIIDQQQANEEWNTEKSAGSLIAKLRSIREELE